MKVGQIFQLCSIFVWAMVLYGGFRLLHARYKVLYRRLKEEEREDESERKEKADVL